MNDLVVSLIRTYVPMVVGAVVAWLVTQGINVDQSAVEGVVAFLTAVFSGLYYVVVRLLEQRWPKLGWLLGQAKELKYKVVK